MGIMTETAGTVKVSVSMRHAAGMVRRAKRVWCQAKGFGLLRVSKAKARSILRVWRAVGARRAEVTVDLGHLILEGTGE